MVATAAAPVTLLTPERALRQPRRFDARVFLGLVVTGVGVIGSIAFWISTSDSRTVLVAARDLPAGATLNATDLKVARVRVDDAIYRAALPGDDLGTVAGKQLAEPVHAFQLVTRAQLSARPALAPDQVALTVPVSPETAVGGRLRPGDLVQVLVTVARGRPESRTAVVLPRASIFDVGYDERAAVINAAAGDAASTEGGAAGRPRGPLSWVTLALTPEQALQVSAARWNGEIDLALLPPES